MHDVTPIVVAIAVSMLMSICSAHFQDPFFIINFNYVTNSRSVYGSIEGSERPCFPSGNSSQSCRGTVAHW